MSKDELVLGTSGLVANYEVKSHVGTVATATLPIVGFLRDIDGGLTAAVVGDGGKLVRVREIPGFTGTAWSSQQSFSSVSGVDDSLFGRVFGKSPWR